MYLHIGNNVVVNTRDVVGIFDVDNKKNNVFLIDGYEHKATEPEEDKEKSSEETE